MKGSRYLLRWMIGVAVLFAAVLFYNSSLKFEIMAKQLYVASQRVL